MKTFKDINGRDWVVAVNVNAVKRVRDLTTFDLLKVVEDKNAILSLGTDLIMLVDVLYALCKPEADAASITDVKFAEALGGDALEAAYLAMLEDVADFFPAHKRGPLKAALAKLKQIQDKAAKMQMDRIASPELENEITEILAKAINGPQPSSGNSSTNPQVSPGLTLAG